MSSPIIVAELGINHHGNVGKAIELAKGAVAAGADAIKLQLFDPWNLAEYRCATRGLNTKQHLELLQTLHNGWLTLNGIVEISDAVADYKPGTAVFASVFDPEGVKRYADEGFRVLKLSVEQGERPEMQRAMVEFLKGDLDRQGIISFGLDSQTYCQGYFEGELMDRLTFLWCPSGYPTKPEDMHLSVIRDGLELGVNTGVSLHATDVYAPIIAAAAGAQLIELHVQDNYDHDAPERAWSYELDHFAYVVEMIRKSADMMGKEAA